MSEQAQPNEVPRTPEIKVREAVTPVVAHLAFGAVNAERLHPENRTVTPEDKKAFVEAKPEALRPLLKAAGKVSWESANESFKGDGKNFDQRNLEWNAQFSRFVHGFAYDQSLDADIKGERVLALNALGIDAKKQTGDVSNGLNQQIEDFRARYLHEVADQRDLTTFVQDISQGCKSADGTINMEQLQFRLHAIEPLLTVFGKHNDIRQTVIDLAVTNALLTQPGETKHQAVEAASFQITRPIDDKEGANREGTPFNHTEHTRLAALWEKYQPEEPEKPDPTEPKEPPPTVEQPKREETPTEHLLTPELAKSDPEKFKTLVLDDIGEYHPLAHQAWEIVKKYNLASFEKIVLDHSTVDSHIDRAGLMTLGVHENAEDLRQLIHFANYGFNYKDDVSYRFSHEVSHPFLDLLRATDTSIALLEDNIAHDRTDHPTNGLTALGSSEHYRKQGPKIQAQEDVTELVNMYLFDPSFLQTHLAYLSDPSVETDRSKSGLMTLSQERANDLYTIVEKSVQNTVSRETESRAETVPLTPELARQDPERFKSLIIEKLGEKHPLARQAWDKAVRDGIISFDNTTIETSASMDDESTMESGSDSTGISIGSMQFDAATRAQFFEDLSNYENQMMHAFTHELNHKLLSKLFIGKTQEYDNIFRYAKAVREETPDEGLSLLGNNKEYQKKENPAYEQAKEDLTEMLTMYMLNPNSLKNYLEYLSDPDKSAEREGRGLVTMSKDAANTIYTQVDRAVKIGLGNIPPTETRAA